MKTLTLYTPDSLIAAALVAMGVLLTQSTTLLANGVYTIIAQSDEPAITGSVAASTVNGTAYGTSSGRVSPPTPAPEAA